MIAAADIVAEARSMVGTRFQHQARLPGVAIDCAGVVICVARNLGIVPPCFDVTAYPREADGVSLLRWCRQYMTQVEQADMQPGDVVAVVYDEHPGHLGIACDYVHGGLSIVHASSVPGTMRVVETRLLFSQRMRFAAAFRLPGVG
ncbi:MAG TPA: hypothetical protein PK441_01275 [Burkholderiaceae bacterium]|nr:hypothetical protein [Burkholderiaceae bacterium]